MYPFRSVVVCANGLSFSSCSGEILALPTLKFQSRFALDVIFTPRHEVISVPLDVKQSLPLQYPTKILPSLSFSTSTSEPWLARVLVAARLAVASPRQDPPQYRGDCAELVCPWLG
jgi:hypothetical protein